jgi:hypothetical protein
LSSNLSHPKPRAESPLDPTAPTQHAPGSLGKIAILRERVRRGLPLWHPLDNTSHLRPPPAAGDVAVGRADREEEAAEREVEAAFAPPASTAAAADPLARFCCQNEQCADYGKRGAGNLALVMRYGKHQRRLLCCKTCKARFSERKGTPLFQSRLSDEKALCILAHLTKGRGVRETARLVGVANNTVQRYGHQAGRQG